MGRQRRPSLRKREIKQLRKDAIRVRWYPELITAKPRAAKDPFIQQPSPAKSIAQQYLNDQPIIAVTGTPETPCWGAKRERSRLAPSDHIKFVEQIGDNLCPNSPASKDDMGDCSAASGVEWTGSAASDRVRDTAASRLHLEMKMPLRLRGFRVARSTLDGARQYCYY